MAPPVNSAVTGPHSIIVSKNDSIVLVDGLDIGETVTVRVLRGGVPVGTVTGEAEALLPNGFGQFEINHAAAPTVCWEGVTPEILAGDVVELTGGFPTDTVPVDDIEVTQEAVGIDEDLDGTVDAITIKGQINPAPDVATLDAELRLLGVAGLPSGGRWRGAASDPGNSLTYDDPVGAPGAFTATLRTSDDGDVTPAVVAAAADPIVLEVMHIQQDGADGPLAATAAIPGGPHPPEDAACPSLEARAMTAMSPSVINTKNAGASITVSGVTSGASVQVALTDNDPSTNAAVAPLTATPAGVAPAQTWQVVFPPAEVAKLNGTITAVATHTPTAGGVQTNTRTVFKDIVAPAAPAAFPNGGTFVGSQSVTFNPGAGETIRYTLGDGTQAAPTATSGTVYGAAILLNQTSVLKAIAIDGAGNESAVAARTFTRVVPTVPGLVVTPPGTGTGPAAVRPLAPSIGQAKSGKAGGAKTATATWRAPRANGAILNGYAVRAIKIRPGKDKVSTPVRVGPTTAKLKMTLPAGKYRFQVRATSAAGDGAWSAPSNKVAAR